MLEIHELSAGYGPAAILKNITLAVEASEIVTLLGSNGAGKTTLFRAVSGQIRPRKGKIAFRGQDLARMTIWDNARLGIGYVPEGRHLFAGLSVLDNLELAGLHAGRLRGEGLRTQLESAFGLFPILRERQRQLAGTLSGGQQQMVAIARALMTRPKFLILDEPSLGLAPRIIEEIFAAIRAINLKGMGVLLIEQNTTALRISDRVYVLERGEMVFSGSARELSESRDIAEFYLSGGVGR